MSDIAFSFDTSSIHTPGPLILNLQGYRNRKVYFDFLCSEVPGYKELFKELLLSEGSYNKAEGRGDSLSLVPLNKVRLSKEKSCKVIIKLIEAKLIIQSKKVVQKGQVNLPLFVGFETQGLNHNILKLYTEVDYKKVPLQDQTIVRLKPHFCIIENKIHFFDSEIPFSFFENVNKEISKRQKERYLDLIEDCACIRLFNEEFEQIEPKPVLEILSPSLSFANLHFEYEGHKVLFQNQNLENRNQSTESLFEQDLIDVGFEKKRMEKTHYFCSPDKVNGALSLLLDIGWEIFDQNEQKLIQSISKKIELKEVDDSIEISGEVEYEGQKIALSGVSQSSHGLIKLSGNQIGLLPKNWLEKEVIPIINASKNIGGKYKLPKTLYHLCQNLDPQTTILDKNLKSLFEEKQSVSIPTSFNGELWPYQQEGLNWLSFLSQRSFNGLLADDMGLGKTIQMIAFLSTLKINMPVLIVAPTSLIYNWKSEINKFYPALSVYAYQGIDRRDITPSDQVVLCSYALLRQDVEKLSKIDYQVVALDEAQNIKNPKSQTHKAAIELNSDFKVCLTGTPIENSITDLISLFGFLMPKLSEKLKTKSNELKWIKKAASPFILRRKKSEVLKDLPEKIEQTVIIESSDEEKEAYQNLLIQSKQKLKELKSQRSIEALTLLLRLRQHACHPLLVNQSYQGTCSKFEAVMEDIETLSLEGNKILVFSQFVQMLKILETRIKEKNLTYCYLDGQTKNREKVIDQFQNDENTSIFLMSLKAGGVGLNLTKADYVLIYDPWFNQAIENQAIDRAHRIGRDKKVIAKRYVLKGTVEEKIQLLKQSKGALSDAILDDKELSNHLDLDDLLCLFN